MNAPSPVPALTHNLGQEQQLEWVHAAVVDLNHRGTALEHLIRTTRSWGVEDGDLITVRVDRDAWFAAVAAASTPRPAFPASN